MAPYPDPAIVAHWVNKAMVKSHYMKYPDNYQRPTDLSGPPDNRFYHDDARFKRRQHIGGGGFGDIYLVDYTRNMGKEGARRFLLALKVFKRPGLAEIEGEAHKIHRRGDHIVHTLCPDVRDSNIIDAPTAQIIKNRIPNSVVYHWYPLGSLDNVLHRLWHKPNDWALTVDMYWEVLHSLVSAIAEMAAFPRGRKVNGSPKEPRPILHFDLDPSNVLVQALDWGNNTNKLGDKRAQRNEQHRLFPKVMVADLGMQVDLNRLSDMKSFRTRYALSMRGKDDFKAPEQTTLGFNTLDMRRYLSVHKPDRSELAFFKHPNAQDHGKIKRTWLDDSDKWLPETTGNYGVHTNIYQLGVIMASILTGIEGVREYYRVEHWQRLALFPMRSNNGTYLTHGSFVLPHSPVNVRVKWSDTDSSNEKLRMDALRVLVCQCMAVAPRDRPDLSRLLAATTHFANPSLGDPEPERYAKGFQQYLLGDDTALPPGGPIQLPMPHRAERHRLEERLPHRLFGSDRLANKMDRDQPPLTGRLYNLGFWIKFPAPKEPDITTQPVELAIMPLLNRLRTKPLFWGKSTPRPPPEMTEEIRVIFQRRTTIDETLRDPEFVCTYPRGNVYISATYPLLRLRGAMGTAEYNFFMKNMRENNQGFSFAVNTTIFTFTPSLRSPNKHQPFDNPPPHQPGQHHHHYHHANNRHHHADKDFDEYQYEDGIHDHNNEDTADEAIHNYDHRHKKTDNPPFVPPPRDFDIGSSKSRGFYQILRFRQENTKCDYMHLVTGHRLSEVLEGGSVGAENMHRLLIKGKLDRFDRTQVFDGPWSLLRQMGGGHFVAWNLLCANYRTCSMMPSPSAWANNNTFSPPLTHDMFWQGRSGSLARFKRLLDRFQEEEKKFLWTLMLRGNAQFIFSVSVHHLDCVWFKTEPVPADTVPGKAWFVSSLGKEANSVVNFIIGINLNQRLTASDAALMLMEMEDPGNFGLSTIASLSSIMGKSRLGAYIR